MQGYKMQSQAVKQMGQIEITGNVIPPEWFQQLTLSNGKPNLPAIIILSDLVYWYKPTKLRDEETGRPLPPKQKFKADKLQRSYAAIAEQYGFGKDQAREACHYLQSKGLITLEFRTIESSGVLLNNVMFPEIVPEAVRKITHTEHVLEPESECSTPPPIAFHTDTLPCSTPPPVGFHADTLPCSTPPPVGFHADTYTETSSETSSGRESAPVFDVSAIWQEVFGEPIGVHQQTVLEASGVSDEQVFRCVLALWKTNGYSRRNLTGVIERYRDELEKKNKATLKIVLGSRSKYACQQCQDTGSISVFVEHEFSRYADCPACQQVREAA